MYMALNAVDVGSLLACQNTNLQAPNLEFSNFKDLSWILHIRCTLVTTRQRPEPAREDLRSAWALKPSTATAALLRQAGSMATAIIGNPI